MNLKGLEKIVGIGLKGAAISLTLLMIAVSVDQKINSQAIIAHSLFMKTAGLILISIGLVLHFWTAWTLRNWWIKDQLCVFGPFKYFRHPMYAAWISFISFGVAFYLNSWIYLFWALFLHPIWHRLVRKEEKMMLKIFKDDYNEYAKHTGRFIPRIWY